MEEIGKSIPEKIVGKQVGTMTEVVLAKTGREGLGARAHKKDDGGFRGTVNCWG